MMYLYILVCDYGVGWYYLMHFLSGKNSLNTFAWKAFSSASKQSPEYQRCWIKVLGRPCSGNGRSGTAILSGHFRVQQFRADAVVFPKHGRPAGTSWKKKYQACNKVSLLLLIM